MKYFFSTKQFLSKFAGEAVRISPYPAPENLEKVIHRLHSQLNKFATVWLFSDTNKWHEIKTDKELLAFIGNTVLLDSDVLKWNDRKNGRDGPGLVSAYEGIKDPDDDFIDLDALQQNIFRSLIEFALSEGEPLPCECNIQFQVPNEVF